MPACLTRLGNGDIMMTTGHRIEPKGIRGFLSSDEGRSWSEEIVFDDTLGNTDCGYPSTVRLDDGRLLTTYYSGATYGKHSDPTGAQLHITVWSEAELLGAMGR
jgi:hypothetical protein